jgi:hypothetical protein
MMKRLLVILTLLASSLGVLFAQDYRGTVQGLVTDSSQAVIVGAKITLRNVNTGISVTKESNNLGNYRFDFVDPGTYTVVTEVAGFAKSIQQNVVVGAKGDITVNFTLKPGSVNQSVTVTATAGAVALEFNTSGKELTVTRTELTELPFQYRSPFTAVLLDPAVVNAYTAPPYPYYMWQASEMDFGGQTSRENDVLLDGSPTMIGPKGAYTPTMDDVQEVVVEQVAVDAEYGHSAGGVTNMATRAGTNTFHGAAYYYGINPSLNAVTNVFTRTPSVSRNNMWGASAGGPIKKNKLFTFAAYEGRLNSTPNTTTMTLPTAAERNGDYSQSLNKDGDLRIIYNPFTTVYDPEAGTQTRTPFYGNNISSMIDPTAAKIMTYIWKPNSTPSNQAGADNFRSTVGIDTHYWNFSDRTDWNVSDKLKVFGHYSQFHSLIALPDYTGVNSPAESPVSGGPMNAKNLGGDVVYTINPTTVVDGRFSYGSFIDDAGVPQNEIGASGLAALWPDNPWYQPYLNQYGGKVYFPGLTIGTNPFGVPSLYHQEPHSYSWTGKMVKSAGRHTLKAGLEARYQAAFIVYPSEPNFNFSAATTSSSSITAPIAVNGDPYATFLLGAPGNGSYAKYTAPGQFSNYYYGAYVQDDFKLNRRITLNLGLRYEYESAPVDAQNKFSRVDLKDANPTLQANPPQYTADVLALRSQYLGASAATPPPNGEWLYATSGRRGEYDAPGINFAPRAGIAFRLNDKTALRAGYGRFLILNGVVQMGLLEIPEFVGYNVTSTILPSVNGVPMTALSNPFPSNNPLQAVVGNSLGVNTNLGNGYGNDWQFGFRDPNYKDGALDRFDFTVQRELPGNFQLNISFVETNGRHMDSNAFYDNFNANEANPSLYYDTLQGATSVQYPNPFYQYLTPAQFPGSLRNQPTVPLWQLLRPLPQYGDLFESHVPVEGDKVRNFEIQVRHTYANSFSLLGSYVYNREQMTAWPDNDMTDGPYYYNRAPLWEEGQYPRHRAIVSTLYALPVGRGKKNLAHLNPVLDGVLGGWSVSSIINITSGQPLRFGGPDVVTGDPSKNVPAGYGFNPGAFALLPAYTPQNGPLIFPGVDGPVRWNIDGELSKSFRLREGIYLHFRMEAYNLTNSVVWANEDNGYGDSTFGEKNLSQNNIGRTLQYSLRLTF